MHIHVADSFESFQNFIQILSSSWKKLFQILKQGVTALFAFWKGPFGISENWLRETVELGWPV